MAVVPVFVSSTFRDFHGERDILAGPVRERLDELIAPLGMRVELIDLRWGVDTLGVSDDAAAAKVLDVCLAEVKRARPLFLGLLGDRLGYVPAALHARTVASQVGVPQTQPVEGLSVTALEFGFGLLWDVAPAGDHVVVFRDLIGQPPPGWADPDPAAVEAFRHEVAAAVRDRSDVVVAEYAADVESGSADLDRVRSAERTLTFEDLLVDLLAEPVTGRATSLAEQQAATGSSGSERLFRDDHEIIVGRDEMVAQVVDLAASGGRVVLAGESGSGKSTVLCAAESVLRERGITVVSSLLGASTIGASARALIEHLAEQISRWSGRELVAPTDLNTDGLAQWWRDSLTETVSAAGPFVMVVDALDAFVAEPERSDIWPVRGLPAGVGMVASTTVAVHAQILENAGAVGISVNELPGPVAADAAHTWTTASGRHLPATVLDHVATEARVPLWVRLAVDLLADLDADDFAAIAEASDQAQAIADLLTTEVRAFPAELPRLIALFLDTVAERLDADSASILLGALAVSRSGLAPADLAALLPDDADATITVATLRRVLGGQLRESDTTGRLTFSHSALRTAAETRAPADIHARIVRLLNTDTTWDTTDTLDAVWHAVHSADTSTAPALATALNARRHGTQLTLMRALRSHPTGQQVLDALNPEHLSATGIETLLSADEDWGSGFLSVRARTTYAHRALIITRETAAADSLIGIRNTLWATGNLGTALTAAGDLAGARTAYTEQLNLARQLRERQPDTIQSVRDVSVSLDNVGHVLTATGDLAGAHTAHHESLTLRRQLQAAQPDAIEPIRDVSISLSNVGDALVATGDLAGARTAYQESLTLRRQLQAAQPDAIEPIRDVTVSLNNVGGVLWATGDLAGARTAYTESLTLRRQLQAAQPDAIEPLRDVTVSLDNVGDVLVATGDLAGARTAYHESLDLARQLRAAQPDAIQPLRDVTVSLDNVGRVLSATGDPVGARTAYHESLDLARQLRAAQPDAIQPIRDVSISLNNVGGVLWATGDLAGARTAYTESLTLRRQLQAAQPDAIEPIRDVTVSLSNVGDVLVATGDLAGARTAYQESLTLRRQLQAAQPDAIQPIRDVTVSLNNVGGVLSATGDPVGARTAYHESLDLARQLRAAQPDAIQPIRDVTVSLDNVGRILSATGDLAGARTAYQESLDLRRELRERQADAIRPVRDVTVSLNNVGQVLSATGDLAGARTAYQESLTLRRELRERQPDAIQPVRDVTVSLDNVGRVLEATSDLAGARTAYQESLTLRRQLQAAQPDAIQPIRDVTVSLDNVGRVLSATGDLAGARTAFTECLNLARQLQAAQSDAIEPLRDVSISLNNVGRVLSATGDLAGARTAYHESLTLRRELRERQPDAIQPVQDLAASLALVAGTLDHDIDAFGLRLEERQLRATIFTTLRSAASARAWARLNLRIDAYITAQPPEPSDNELIALHRTLLEETANLLELPDNAQPLPNDLHAELARVRNALAEFPDTKETRE